MRTNDREYRVMGDLEASWSHRPPCGSGNDRKEGEETERAVSQVVALLFALFIPEMFAKPTGSFSCFTFTLLHTFTPGSFCGACFVVRLTDARCISGTG